MNNNKVYQSIIKNTFFEFSRNKVRTFLTSIGITVGVFSVVLLIAIGLGLKNYLTQQFSNLGANIVALVPGNGANGGFAALAGSIRFDEEDVRTLERIQSIDYVAPAFISNLTLEYKNEEKVASLIGTSESYGPLFALELLAGKFFDKSDVSSAAKVGYIGETLAGNLFGEPERAINQYVKGRDIRFRVIGVVKNIGNPSRDNAIYVPYTTTFSKLNPKKDFFTVYAGIENKDFVAQARKEIEKVMLKKYDEDEFGVFEPSEILSSLDQIFAVLNVVVASIASISLIVGGIGIMNIMYANVTERTKEIGIRRAIGATRGDVLVQFLAESTVLSFLGGVLGLLLAGIIVLIIRNFFPAEINLISVGLSVGISSFIGIFFGVFPARRAANLTPIEAIRN